jgi:hypothetical protein
MKLPLPSVRAVVGCDFGGTQERVELHRVYGLGVLALSMVCNVGHEILATIPALVAARALAGHGTHNLRRKINDDVRSRAWRMAR